jgi:hypothetical protein
MTDEFPIVHIHLSTYIRLAKKYTSLVWDSHGPWGSPNHPPVGFTYCQHSGRILAYPIKIVPSGFTTLGSWYNLGAIGYPFYDRALLHYCDSREDGVIRRGYNGWYLSRSSMRGLKKSDYDFPTPVSEEARKYVLYEIVIVPDDVSEDVSKLQVMI